MQPQITEAVTKYEGLSADLEGYTGARRNATNAYQRRVNEASKLIARVALGQEDPFLLKQAFNPTADYAVGKLMESYPGLIVREGIGGMSVTDFSILTIDVLDRVLYGYYNAMPIVSEPLVKKHTLNDFRNVSRYLMDGATDPPEEVQPGAAPKEKVLTQEPLIQYAPKKYSAFTRVVWEAMVNDDLGAFNDLGGRLAIGANRGIEKFLTGLYVDANGPNANLYKTAFTNQITIANGAASNNPALDAQGLQDAFKVLARMLDPDGYPIIITGKLYLVYGPAYVATAQNLLNQVQTNLAINGGTTNVGNFPSQWITVNNWMVQNLTPIMNPFMRLVCTTAITQDTQWMLVAEPGKQNRPAMEFGFLRGFDTPQLFAKVPNTMRAGGGGPDASMGDFYTMSQEMKILTVYGGKQVDGRSTVASTGRGV